LILLPNIVQRAYTKSRAIRQELRARSHLLMTDLSHLEYFVIFVGNPRSGTTLVRTLLDAHPNVVIGNEVHILRLMKAGKNWNAVVRRILENSNRFAKNPTWTDYSYRIHNYPTNSKEMITVIGNKRAGGTTKALMEEPALLFKLFKFSSLPIRFIHCVRHPYDVIATKTRRNKQSMEYNRQRYFQLEKGAAHLFSLLGPRHCKRVYHEALIANPTDVLQDVLQFLGVTAEPAHLKACQALIYDKPHQSRFKSEWTAQAMAAVEQDALGCDHLSYYLDQGRLLFDERSFDEAPTETTD
jgi:hypothetical protein